MKKLVFYACISFPLLISAETNECEDINKLPPVANKYIEEFAKMILKDNGDAKDLNCDRAVLNAKDSIDTMLHVGEKNYRDGYIGSAEYQKMTHKLKKIQDNISHRECNNSKGKVRDFYKCMSNDNNHVVTCGKKSNY